MSVIISSFCLLPSPPLSLALFIYLFYETLLRDVTTGTQRVQNRTNVLKCTFLMHDESARHEMKKCSSYAKRDCDVHAVKNDNAQLRKEVTKINLNYLLRYVFYCRNRQL